ncbi:cysteine hydrolase family protein [Rhizomonospora bruguierae]|uniref:cysteine hydrolase family protein n=1 Tax=Rhizomonospora bruguierae TaxID=1581705 RepID=UPI001BCCBA98|nr:isochorismatase family protein [Micromonospora sp. NBRC 107566]
MEQAGWDRFLTDRDREVLRRAGREKTQPFGFGSKPALLVVDVYYAALGTERADILESVKRWPMSCGSQGWEAVDRIATLLDQARSVGVPVVHIGLLEGFASPWARETRNVLSKLTAEERARAYQLVNEVYPRAGELVVEKTAPSAFQGTPLKFHLTALGIDTLIVCGESTSGCVRATVVDAATHRYKVGVVSDACFDRTEASHWINLFDMDQKYADVVGVAAAGDYLAATASTAA